MAELTSQNIPKMSEYVSRFLWLRTTNIDSYCTLGQFCYTKCAQIVAENSERLVLCC